MQKRLKLGQLISTRQSPSLLAFRFQPAKVESLVMTLEVARYTPQAVLTANVEEAEYNALMAQTENFWSNSFCGS
jgi:hypothetical protein